VILEFLNSSSNKSLSLETPEDIIQTLQEIENILGYDFSVDRNRVKEYIREEKIKSLGI